tara:strand:+ start:1661 stop:1777 length:117 start_codon:yes stop_codon:yes gene_type:complete
MRIHKVFFRNMGFVRIMSHLCDTIYIKKVADGNGMEKK